MTAADRDDSEQVLASILVAYDEALDRDTLPALDESLVANDELQQRFDAARECVELLARVRKFHEWSTIAGAPGSQGATESVVGGQDGQAATQPVGLPVPRQIGRFHVERELGRGGLGVVYLATDPELARQVALKVPRPDMLANGEVARRFVREAEAAARLSHPHLVGLHEVGRDDAHCYLVCEYCPGPTLAEWLRCQTGPVPWRQAAALVLRVAEGVQHAHGRGVLHRDIKPSNVLLVRVAEGADADLSSAGLDLSPKLTDFGMAKLLEQEQRETRTGAILGTLAYMSPEQAEGHIDQLDARTDIYSLGAMLYELLTGMPPYAGKSDADTLRQLVTNEPRAPRRLRADVPRDLEAICLKCLSRERERRYVTAQELADDLKRFLAGQPTVARPLGLWERGWKWTKRRPAFAALVAVTTLAASGLVAGGAAYTIRLRQHAEVLSQALTARDEARATARSHEDADSRTYPTNLRLANDAWREGRFEEARTLLEKHLPRAGERDRRSFAWHFLWRLCQVEPMVLTGHRGPVYACSYSPDGRWLASGGEDGLLRIWNPSTGTLDRSWQAHAKDVSGIAFSPDGKLVATMAENVGAKVWEVATGNCVQAFDMAKGTTLAVAFTPDGQTLVAGNGEGEVSLWKTADWSSTGQFSGLPAPIRMLGVSPDGKTLASTSDDTSVRLWRLADMHPLATFGEHRRAVTTIAFSHDGKKLATACRGSTIKWWSVEDYNEFQPLDAHRGWVHQVAFTPDDRWLLASGHRGEAQFWRTDRETPGRILRGGDIPFYAAAISPDGKQLAAGGSDGILRIWNEGPEPKRQVVFQDVPGRQIAVSPDERLVAMGDFEGNVQFYDLASGEFVRTFAAHPGRKTDAIRFSAQGDRLVTVGSDNRICFWKYPELTLLHTFTGHAARVRAVRFSPSGDVLASCSDDRTIRFWDPRSGRLRHTILAESAEEKAVELAFSPDGRHLAGACLNGKIRVWRTSDATEVAAMTRHTGEARRVAWSVDGTSLASGSKDGSVCLWDTASWSLSEQIEQLDWVKCLAFSPDGQTLAIGNTLGKILLYDVDSRKKLLELAAHSPPSGVEQLIFDAGGRNLLSFRFGPRSDLFRWSAE